MEQISKSHKISLIEHKQHSIDALLLLTKAINENRPKEYIFELYSKTLKDKFKYTSIFILYKTTGGWFVVENENHSLLEHLDLVEFLEPFREVTYLEKEEVEFGEYDTIVPVFHNQEPLAYVMIAGVHNRIVDSLEEEMRFLQTYTNVAVIAAENKRLYSQEISRQLELKEMQTAAEIQKALIPQEYPEYESCRFAAEYMPHSQIGGDGFDLIPHPTANAFYLSIADVSGKGVSAALLMANFQAIFRSSIQYQNSPEAFARTLNSLIYRITKGERFVSLFLAVIHLDKRTIKYINFGHNPPILQTENGDKFLDKGSTILGVFEELPFLNIGEEAYGDKAMLFSYTDGLIDILNEKDAKFDTTQLKQFLEERRFADPKQLNAELVEYINHFRGRRKFTDDVTFLTTLIDHTKV